jgi:HAD superfamily hydrolase (TIGR01509 family)
MPLRYVLWDNDGVLVDTEEGYFRATQRALDECGVRLERAPYLELRARGASAWDMPDVRRLGDAAVVRHRALRDEYYQQFIRGEALEIAGVRDVLAALARHYRMAIVTTCKRRDFDVIHRERALIRHMEFVLTREDFVNEKPAPDGYLAALERLGATAEEAVVVEDSAQGLGAARAAGLRCVIVRNRFFGAAHDFDGAAAVLESIAHLPDALQRLASDARDRTRKSR